MSAINPFGLMLDTANDGAPSKALLALPHGTTSISYDITAEQYHADPFAAPSLSASIATVLDRQSPKHAHCLHPKLGGHRRAPTAALEGGTLIHALLLGEEDKLRIVDVDDWRTKAAKEERAHALALGMVPVKRADFDDASATAEVLTAGFAERGIALKGASEVTVFWTEEADDGTVVQCRARMDHIDGFSIFDLKSCRSTHPDALVKHVDSYGYAIQRAAYVSALEAALGPRAAGRVSFTFLFFELDAPNDIVPAELSGAFRELGERRWRRAVNLWARCLRDNRWPGHADHTITIEPPTWAVTNEMARESDEAFVRTQEQEGARS